MARTLITNRGEEVVDDLVLLDRHRVEEDLLERADAALLHEAAELGHRNPLILRGTTPSRNRRCSLARRVDSLTATSMASRRCAPSQKASCMPTHKATGSSSGYKQQPRNRRGSWAPSSSAVVSWRCHRAGVKLKFISHAESCLVVATASPTAAACA